MNKRYRLFFKALRSFLIRRLQVAERCDDCKAVNYIAITVGVLGLVFVAYIAAVAVPDAISAFNSAEAWDNTPTAVRMLVPVACLVVFCGLLFFLLKFLRSDGD